jgi:hypothetical protein
MRRILIKKYFLFTEGSVCRVKPFTTGSRNSLKDVRKSQAITDQVAQLRLRQSNCAAGGRVDSLIRLLPSYKALEHKIIYYSFHNILSHLVTAALNLQQMGKYIISSRSRDSVVGIATGYELNYRGVRVRVPVGSRIFSSTRRPDRPRGPSSLLSNGYRGLFPGDKAAEA